MGGHDAPAQLLALGIAVLRCHNTSKGSALHTRLSLKSKSHQRPLQRLDAVEGSGMLDLGLPLTRGPLRTLWVMVSAVPLPCWRGRAALSLLRRARRSSKPEKRLAQSLTILQHVRGRGAASKTRWLPPRSLPAGPEPCPRGTGALVERDTHLPRNYGWGKGRGRSPWEGEE